jgi:Na+/proline symporter
MLTKVSIVSIYALAILILGILGMRKTRSFSDFFLGGGKIGAWMTAFTYATAYFPPSCLSVSPVKSAGASGIRAYGLPSEMR